jgi:hypothetical protein
VAPPPRARRPPTVHSCSRPLSFSLSSNLYISLFLEACACMARPVPRTRRRRRAAQPRAQPAGAWARAEARGGGWGSRTVSFSPSYPPSAPLTSLCLASNLSFLPPSLHICLFIALHLHGSACGRTSPNAAAPGSFPLRRTSQPVKLLRRGSTPVAIRGVVPVLVQVSVARAHARSAISHPLGAREMCLKRKGRTVRSYGGGFIFL